MTYTNTVIAGCGNPLFGDDGFGSAVAEELQNFPFPAHIMAIDAGMSAPELLFPLLDPAVTKKIIIIDSVDFGGKPGSVVLLQPGDFPEGGIHDAHQGGIIGSLGTIRAGIEILVIGCQPGRIIYPEMEIGLSGEVNDAIPTTIRIIQDIIRRENATLTEIIQENCCLCQEIQSSSIPDTMSSCTFLKSEGTSAGSD